MHKSKLINKINKEIKLASKKHLRGIKRQPERLAMDHRLYNPERGFDRAMLSIVCYVTLAFSLQKLTKSRKDPEIHTIAWVSAVFSKARNA